MTRPTNQPTNPPTDPPPPAVLAVLGKGGSGKTTSAAAVGDALSRELGRRVRLLDVDAQASLTDWLAPRRRGREGVTVDDVLTGAATLDEIARPLRPGLALLPAANGLAVVEPTLAPDALRRRVLARTGADVVVIDTPAMRPLGPGATVLRSVLAAADVALVPFRCTVLDLDALDETLAQIEAHEQLTSRRVPVLLLPTMVTRDGAAELVTRALRLGGLTVLPPVPLSSWAAKAAADRCLLADRAPRGAAIVEQYAAAAVELCAVLDTTTAKGSHP